jgi:hypothetical protein
MKALILLFFGLFHSLFALANNHLSNQGITQATLGNGLKIVVKVDQRAPVLSPSFGIKSVLVMNHALQQVFLIC